MPKSLRNPAQPSNPELYEEKKAQAEMALKMKKRKEMMDSKVLIRTLLPCTNYSLALPQKSLSLSATQTAATATHQ